MESKLAGYLLDLLREVASAETFEETRAEADLIEARDYTLSHLFPTGATGPEQDTLVEQVTDGEPGEVENLLQQLVRAALRRLSATAQRDRKRKNRRAAMEAAGREWDPEEDEWSEWIDRIEESRKNTAMMLVAARKEGIPAVSYEGMEGDTFRSGVAFAGMDRALTDLAKTPHPKQTGRRSVPMEPKPSVPMKPAPPNG